MEKLKRKNWIFAGLISIALVLMIGVGLFVMPQQSQVVYAATERVVTTLRASTALNSNGSSGLWSWELTGSTTVRYDWDLTLNDYVNAVSLPASSPESLFTVRWSNPDSIKITKVVVSARLISGHIKYNQVYFNGDDTASYSKKSSSNNVFTYTQRDGQDDNGVMRFRVGNVNNEGMSDAVFNIKSITIYAEATTTPVTIAAGTGVKSVYLSTTNNATSGSASGTEFDDGATVYGFAELAKGYNAPSGWTLVGGTANTEGAKYRVGSVSAGSSNFGTKSADLATYTISYNLNGGAHGTTHPSSYNVTSNTFTISNPTRDGYTFKGWSGTGLSGDTNKNVSVAKGSIGNRTYTANWTANQYTITYNANSGTVSPTSVTYKTNNNSNTATAQNITLATPTRAGYTFAGWTTTKSGVSISNKTALTINANTYGDFTVTANWTANQYTITYNANNGIVSPASVTYKTNNNSNTATSQDFTLATPTRVGYTFDGWTTTKSGVSISNKTTLTINANIYGDFTVTANWTAKTYDLTFDNGESQGGDAGVTATYDEVLPNVSIPTLDGYTFAGYYDQENGAGNKYIDNAGHGCKAWDKDSAPTLYAYFTENMSVEFDGYDAEYDRDSHTISVNPTNPLDATIMYGTEYGTYNLEIAPTYTDVGEYTVYFEITKLHYTTYRGSATVVITKTNAEYETLPAAVEGLVYNDEDFELITVGELRYNDSGDIVYKITYTNPDTNEEFETEYSTAIPTGHFATTYTVYYKALGNSNYNPIAEASFTVTIAQVDKTELLALIAKVDEYHNKITEGYADIDTTMMAERTVSQNNYINKANVTSAQIVAQVEDLQEVFSIAKIDVVKQKIVEIGEVERTPKSKALIDDAREYFEDLTEEEKNGITNIETLEKSEKTYDKLVHDFKVMLACSIIFGTLGLCLIVCGIIYLILFFKKNKWIIEDDKVVRAYACKKTDKNGNNVRKLNMKKVYRPKAEIYDTKEEALAALRKPKNNNDNGQNNEQNISAEQAKEIEYRNRFNKKLKALPITLQKGYVELKKEVLSFVDVKTKMGQDFEYILFGDKTIMKFAVQENALCVFYALDPNGLISRYNVQKVNSNKHTGTPCVCRIKNSGKLDNAKKLISFLAEKYDLNKS